MSLANFLCLVVPFFGLDKKERSLFDLAFHILFPFILLLFDLRDFLADAKVTVWLAPIICEGVYFHALLLSTHVSPIHI